MKIVKVLVVLMLVVVVMSEHCSAMKFSQPVKIGGGVVWSQIGGFMVRDATSNRGEKNYFRAGKAQNFSKGIAQFGTGDTIVYEHYDYEKYGTDVLIGGEEVSNTFSIPSIENFSISRIKNDSNTKMFMIELGNDVHWEDGYVIFGKKADGRFVKYFNTYEIRNKYFGNSDIAFGDIIFNNDTIIIFYEQQTSPRRYTKVGEFRFKWDDAAQWFSVEQIKY